MYRIQRECSSGFSRATLPFIVSQLSAERPVGTQFCEQASYDSGHENSPPVIRKNLHPHRVFLTRANIQRRKMTNAARIATAKSPQYRAEDED